MITFKRRAGGLLAATVMAGIAAGCGSVDNDSGGGSTASAGGSTPAATTGSQSSSKEQVGDNVAKVLDFDKTGQASSKKYRIAYLTECADNYYCKARLRGLRDAAKKYNFTFKTFNPEFNPSAQLKLVQDAVSEGGWDGYLFAPTQGSAGCSMWTRFLKPENKPVVTLDLPMCGDADYTPGLAATVTMQRQAYFDAQLSNAFASCTAKCKAVTFSGFTGSDLFNFWTKASRTAAKSHPNVTVIQDFAAQFDPQLARRYMQDALQANPDIKLVVGHDDLMMEGVTAAITSAGLKPGTDVKVYAQGGSQEGVANIKSGEFNTTTIELPYEESYYAAVAMIMALEGKAINGYINEAELPRVTDGPGTVYVTKDNVDRYESNWG